jgi:predicted Zn-dependent peptidase/DNA-binding beta-propeller fold protein YncE
MKHSRSSREIRSRRTLCAVLAAGWLAAPCLAAGAAVPGDAAAWRIETIGGGGGVGDGGPALQARLSLPGGLLVEDDGDLVIVDFGNHRIRRVDAKTGIIRTIAGTGEANFTGDGGPADRAGLARPENAALGPRGEIYVVDEYNHRIRRIDPRTGIITTVAGNGRKGFAGDGGPALQAEVNWPEGIAADAEGNLFLGDTQNRRVRRIDARTGIITTLAGSGESGVTPDGVPAREARFLRIARLAVDREGNVYVADSPAQRIYVIEAKTGLIRTFAGTGEEGSSGDGGPANRARVSYPEGVMVDPHGRLVWCDVGTHRVRRADLATGIITTVAGTGEKGFAGDGGRAIGARLWSPGRLASDPAGNLYVADIGNGRVRRIDAETGIITTVAGSGDLGDGQPARDSILTVPGDVAHAPGRLYVADYGNRRVRRIDLATGRIETVAGGGKGWGEGIAAVEAELLLPEGIALDAQENLYVADNIGSRVYKVERATGRLFTVAGNGVPGYSGDGGPAAAAQLAVPGSVAVAPDGTVFIGDFGNRCIRVVDPQDGTIRTLAGHPILTGLPVLSLAATEEALYWLSAGDPAVYRLPYGALVPERLPVDLPRGPGEDSYFLDLTVGGGEIFIVDTMAHQVLRRDLRTGEVSVVAGSGVQGFTGDGGLAAAAAMFQPGGLTLGTDGAIYIADSKNHRIRKLSRTPPAGASAGGEETLRLANGLEVLLAHDPAPSLVADALLVVQAGTSFEPEDRRGVAGIVAEAFLAGPAGDGGEGASVAARLERHGVSVRLSVERDLAVFRFTMPASQILPFLPLLGDLLARESLPPEAWREARARRAVSVGMAESDPWRTVRRNLDRLVWIGKAEEEPAPESLAQSVEGPLQEFWSSSYRPERMVLALWGVPVSAEIRAALTRELGRLEPRGARTVAPSRTPAPAASGRSLCLEGSTPELLAIGAGSLAADDREFYAWQALCQVLGGGLSSRLHRRLRLQDGIAYTAEASCEPVGRNGISFRVAVQTDRIEAAKAAIREEIARLADPGVTREELEIAVATLQSRVLLDREAREGRFYRRALELLAGQGVRGPDTAAGLLAGLTPEDLGLLVRTRLRPEALATVVAAPREVCPPGEPEVPSP